MASDRARGIGLQLLVAALAVSLLAYAAIEPVGALPILAAVATLAVVLTWTALAFRHNLKLLDAHALDSLTDGLSTLGNERAMLGAADAALAEAERGVPWTMVLFDLDGFDGYRESFGRAAADALLTRLGSSLRDAIGSRGAAFRIGGDEFCLLLRDQAQELEAVVAEAREALSMAGSGFEVRPSHGAVELGAEAPTVARALQVADRRLCERRRARDGEHAETRSMMLSMLRERQPDLDDHVDAVTELSRCVGAELRLSNEELDVLSRAAELHDVGKMAVPDEILRKPGRLTDGEWEIMRQHTIIGERILDGVPALAPVAEVVRATHERYDGGGYPDGLAGEEIPLTARIISVCDAYDAIRSDRTYDQGRSHPLAVLELRRCAGTQFDPKIVDAFCRAIERQITASDDAAPVEDFDRRAWVAAA